MILEGKMVTSCTPPRPEISGGKFVGLVTQTMSPTVREPQLVLHIRVSRQLSSRAMASGCSKGPVARPRRLKGVIGEYRKEGENVRVRPAIVRQGFRDERQAPLESPRDQLLDERPAIIVLPAPGSSATGSAEAFRAWLVDR